jgi:uncharacterized membrane protein YGL010W
MQTNQQTTLFDDHASLFFIGLYYIDGYLMNSLVLIIEYDQSMSIEHDSSSVCLNYSREKTRQEIIND